MTALYGVRVLYSDGLYPSTPLVVAPFGILAADGVAWSAVQSTSRLGYSTTSSRPEAPIGEISWFTPQEIRFLSAATLAEAHPRANGRIRIYTRTWPEPLELEEPVTPDRLVSASRSLAAKTLVRIGSNEDQPKGYNLDPLDRDYTAEVRRLLDRMDRTDSLLHRGLYKLLMATELMRHHQFLEEAALSALISREAALELLRRKLSAAAGTRWKLDDLLAHIATTFPTGEPFVDVLRTDWDVRVMMAHPVSEHGEHWSPPVEAEECYDALHTLTYLYRYLLLDEVWEPAEYD